MHSKPGFHLWISLILTALLPCYGLSQTNAQTPDSLLQEMGTQKLGQDSLRVTPSKRILDDKVIYSSKDSLRFDIKSQMVYLYGEAQVKYQTITLKAAYIELSLKNQQLHAAHMLDSAGAPYGTPHFQDGSQQFDADTMDYNFKSKKGKIRHAATQDSGGNITGKEIKKVDELVGEDTTTVLYIKRGAYETLEMGDQYACFSLQMRKMKIIKDDKVITGPGLLHIENIPTPLLIPFGIFPAVMKGRANGLIIPSYGNSPGLGFFLQRGGYYTGLGQNADLALTGDIYTRGSWAIDSRTRYKVRYKYSGNFNLGYSIIKSGDEDFGTLSKRRNYYVRWQHTQDRKANPYTIFSANVNINNTGNFKNNINSTITQVMTNTFKSSISLQKPFPGKPYNWNLNASHQLNTVDSTVALVLPQSTFSVNRFYPGKWLYRNSAVSKKRFIEQIGVTYLNQVDNKLNTHEDSLLTAGALQDMKAGMRHSVNVNVPFKMGRTGSFVNRLLTAMPVNGRIAYTDVWSTNRIERSFVDEVWDEAQQEFLYDQVETDTFPGFNRFGQMNFSASTNTKVYTRIDFRKGPVKAFRHVLTPTVSYAYTPNWTLNGSQARQGYYVPTDDADSTYVEYTEFANSIYGSPRADSSMSLNFGLMNNLEMKLRKRKDSSKVDQPIKLLERLTFSSSYNVYKDSMRWSDIRFSGNTRMPGGINLRITGSIDPYLLNDDNTGTIDRMYLSLSKEEREAVEDRWRFGRLESFSTAFSYTLREDGEPGTHIDEGLYYVDWTIPWSFSFSYNFRYSKPLDEASFTNTVSMNAKINLTDNWNFSTRTGYDFVNFKPTISRINITRNLNCWNLTFSTIPFGSRQSYNVAITAKPEMLSDVLKLQRRRNFYDR